MPGESLPQQPRTRRPIFSTEPEPGQARGYYSGDVEKFMEARSQATEIRTGQRPKPRFEDRGLATISTVFSPEGFALEQAGQDVITYNKDRGIAVVIDGMSTGTASKEMAKVAARGLRNLLEEAPDYITDAELDQWVTDQLEDYVVKPLQIGGFGGVEVLGVKYLPSTDSLLIVDIGTGQWAIIDESGTVVQAKPKMEKTGKADELYIGLKSDGSAAIEDQRARQTPLVYRISLRELRQGQGTLRILVGSDGYEVCTGQDLAQAAPQIIEQGPQPAVGQITRTNDDVSLLEMTIDRPEKV